MKPILILLLVLLSININAQQNNFSKKAETALKITGLSLTGYGFIRKDYSQNDFNKSVLLCTSGVLIASVPCFFHFFEKNNITIGCEGITYKFKLKPYRK